MSDRKYTRRSDGTCWTSTCGHAPVYWLSGMGKQGEFLAYCEEHAQMWLDDGFMFKIVGRVSALSVDHESEAWDA